MQKQLNQRTSTTKRNRIWLTDKNPKKVVFGQEKAIDEIVEKILVKSTGLKVDNKSGGSGLWVQQE